MTQHAILSASGSKKWLTCTPSARMEQRFAQEESAFAAEGTFAHGLFELEIGKRLKPSPAQDQQIAALQCHVLWSPAMQGHVEAAVEVAMERVSQAHVRDGAPVILIERRLDFSRWVPEGFGTGDVVIVAGDLIEVLDLKYGQGIRIEAQGNAQMRLYALGAWDSFSSLYELERVRTTILQPRLNNYSTEELTTEALVRWADTHVAPQAQAAWAGEGELVPGEHCASGFCKARFQCPARAAGALELAKREFAFKHPELLTDAQITDILSKADLALDWLTDVKGYALRRAEAGHRFEGFKLVEGRSIRRYADHDLVAIRLREAGYPDAAIYERQLLGMTALEKALGKATFSELLGELIVKPPGKPTLVPDHDRRPAISSAASAAADFQSSTSTQGFAP